MEASHLAGGEITATRVTGNVYRIRLSVFRDCSGINLGTTQTIRLDPTNSGSTFRVARVSITDITPLCAGQTSVCQGGSVPGFEEHIYESNVTLFGLPIGLFYTISWESCCRNPSITTLTTPQNDGFYLSTQINPSIINSSPTFLNIPYVTLCAGQPATVSPNGSDPDGDALVYSLTSCLESPTTVVSYGAGFSGTNPLTTSNGFTLNTGTGELSFTPTLGGQVGVICLLAEEFRNGFKIGEIRRDIQVRVLANCSNAAPVITQVSNQIVPVGTQFCVNITATDADLDNITLTSVSSVGSFTLTSASAGNASGTFCFTPALANAGQTYTITIQGQDDGCPSPATGSTTFNITVPVPCNGRATGTGTDASCSGSADGTATVAIQNFTPPVQYSWSNGGFTQAISGLTAGIYGVTVVDGNGCVDSSSVTIGGGTGNVAIATTVTDVNCGQSNGAISASGSGGTAPYTYNLSSVGSNNNGSFSNLASGNYTLTVTDANGCDASSSVTVGFAADTQAPTLVGVPGNAIVSCDNIPAPANVTATDDCDANVTVNFSETNTPGNCPNNFTLNRTWSATDAAGNTSSASQSITVQDLLAPTISCSANITVGNDAGDCGANVSYPAATGSDNCGSVSFTYSQASGSSFPIGTTAVTAIATDDCGNSSSCTFNVTVNDTEAPIAVCTNLTVQLDGNGNASVTAADVNGGSTDNCGIATVSASPTSFDCSNVGANTVTLTVTDVNGNASTCVANVTVENNVAPNAVCKDVTVQLDGNGNATITAADVDGGSSDNCGVATVSASPTSFTCSNVGANAVTLTVTDVNGNTSTCVATVTVEDNVAPNAICTDLTVQLDANGNASTTAADVDGGSNDNCGVATVSASPTSFDCSNVGSNPVTLTVTDVNGNASTCVANVTVEDNVAPNAVCSDLTVQLDGNGNASITASDVNGGSTDNCGVATVSASPTSFDCSNVGNNTVTLSVTDVNGNSSSCTATVTVEDNVAPNAICTDLTVQLDANGNASTTASAVDGGSNDNCGIASITIDNGNFSCSNVGNNTVTLSVIDVNGNSSSCTANVTVEDNVAPNAICTDLTVQLDANGNASTTTADVDGGSNDNCGVATVSASPTSFDCSNVGSNPVTLTVTDVNGNASTCVANVTVEDNVAPNAICTDLTVQLDANGNASTTAADVDGGSTDNCGIAILSASPTSFDCSNVGSNPVTLTVTDVNGNVSTCVADVAVEDNVAPNAVCADITVQLDGNGSAGIVASDIDGGSNDNCGIASISATPTSFDCSNLGGNTVTLSVIDVNGNSSSCTANVEVEDNVAPMITCPANLTFECSDNVPVANANDASATDNCSVVSLTVSESSNGGTGCNGDQLVITRTYTATDQSGNSSSCDQTITVEATAIVLTTSPNAFVFPAYPDSACATISVSAAGGCPGYSYAWSNGATTASQTVCPTESTVYTVTVTDRLGCSTTDSVKVCAIDITCSGGGNNGNGGNGNGGDDGDGIGGNGQGGNGSVNGNGQVHIQMCHVPNGNPNNAMTKCLPVSAVQAHLAAGHGGDHLGACGSISSRNCNFVGGAKLANSILETQESSMEAFPNPFNSEVNIRFVLGQDDFASVKVYDMRGVEVITLFQDNVRSGQAQELRFQPENLTKGIYYARLTTSSGQSMVQKLIFQ